MSIRAPAVAGRFYPANPTELRSEIARFCEAREDKGRIEAKGVLVPHAGYVFSGSVAGRVFSRIVPAPLYLLLGPNHTGLGTRASVWTSGSWRTPLGEIAVDERAAATLIESSSLLEADTDAHLQEHSLEVQLPFLQESNPGARFVPITLGGLSLEECHTLGTELAAFVRSWPEPVLLVTSSDMNHYLSDQLTRDLDAQAIDRMLALDPDGLYKTVRSKGITMCGYLPATAMISAVKELGASHCELEAYATSGDAFGDRDRVVGYAGLIFW